MNDLQPSIAEVADFLEEWAPRSSAQSYDNVGLQVGDPASKVGKAVIALDMTPDVLREAQNAGASFIITHHPLIFKPLRDLTPRTLVTSLALRLAELRIALYSIHTNLDVAAGGVSFALAETLGLSNVIFLERIDEAGREIGLGAVGSLDEPMTLEAFLTRVSQRLAAAALRYTGDPQSRVTRIAVCGGAGADFLEQAIAADADAYVTSDLKYHRFFDALDNEGRARIALIDAGHYETEAMTVDILHDQLSRRFASVDWLKAEAPTNPVRYFTTSMYDVHP